MQDQRIVVVSEKTITPSGKMYKILDLQTTPTKKLPHQYLDGQPRVTEINNGVRITTKKNRQYYLHKGDYVAPLVYKEYVETLRAAGNRLHHIRKEIKKSGRELAKDWKGITTEII